MFVLISDFCRHLFHVSLLCFSVSASEIYSIIHLPFSSILFLAVHPPFSWLNYVANVFLKSSQFVLVLLCSVLWFISPSACCYQHWVVLWWQMLCYFYAVAVGWTRPLVLRLGCGLVWLVVSRCNSSYLCISAVSFLGLVIVEFQSVCFDL